MRRRHAVLGGGLLLLTLGLPTAAGAAVKVPPGGGLDPTFGTAGTAVTPLSPTLGDRFFAAAVGPGNKTYAAGYVTTAGTDQAMAVARIHPNGSLDKTFDSDGFAVVNVAPDRGGIEAARGVAVQSNGSVVMGGPGENTDSGAHPKDADIYVTRITAEGALDTTFGTSGVVRLNLSPGAVTNPITGSYRTDLAYGVLVLPNDKIFITATRGPGGTEGRLDRDFAFIQLTADGALDPSFGQGGISYVNTTGIVNGSEQNLNESARQSIAQPDGKIVVGSYSEGTDNSAIPRVIRLLPDGQLDTTFDGDGIATAPLFGTAPNETEFYDIALQGSSYIVTGYGRPGLSGTVDMFAARFTSDGTWDRTYGDGGLARIDLAGQDDRGRDLVVFPDGRALLVGSGKLTATNLDAVAVMLTPDGQRDPTFDGDGILLVDLGGPADSFFGSARTADRRSAFLAGYKGTSPTRGDDAAVARVQHAVPGKRR
ncbi:MAG: hypothetical protein KY450_10780 [Actinobacteria bacterium]|nr:hypothetical protein [Actinomycetota bacterium]